jgi:ribosomal protein S18 acetylase RimI-like enzyme
MKRILNDMSESAITNAIESNMFELIQSRRAWPRAEVHDDPEYLWCITDIPFPQFNIALRTQLNPEQVDAAIQAAIQRCQQKRVSWAWWCGPSSKPATLRQNLAARGFMPVAEMPCMAVDLNELNEQLSTHQDLMIRQITDLADLSTWCQIVYASDGMPDLVVDAFIDLYTSMQFGVDSTIHYYLGRFNGEPVAASMLFLGAGVAGLYNVATIPDARRKGFGSAITLASLRDARAMGYRAGVLQSTKMGMRIYPRMGFREYGRSSIYVWSGLNPASH